MKNAVSFIVYGILLLVLGAGIFFIYRYTNGFNEDFKTFYIERDGKKILSSKSSATFEPGSEVRFEVGYTFDGLKSEKRDYSVKILPNPEEDFDFTADELYYSWRMAEGFEECFSLDKQENCFTLTIPRNSGKELLAECLRKSFRGNVDLSGAFPEGVDPDVPFFLLRVSSYNETVTYDVAFSVRAPYTVTYETEGGTKDMLAGLTYMSGGSRLSTSDFRFGMIAYVNVALTDSAAEQYTIAGVKIYDEEMKDWRELKYEPDSGYLFRVQTEQIRFRVELAPKSQVYSISYEVSGGEDYGLAITGLPEQGIAGREIAFTAQATGRYYIFSVTVTGSATEDLHLSPIGGVHSNDYSFTMPACDVVIKFGLSSGV